MSETLRLRPWDDDEQAAERERLKQLKINESNQRRPRFHQREMGAEEARQRRVSNKVRERDEASKWLLERVRTGRVDLLQKTRLTGIEKEAQALWLNNSKTVPGEYVRRIMMGER